MLSSERAKRKEMEKTLSQLKRISSKVEEQMKANEKVRSSSRTTFLEDGKKLSIKKKIASGPSSSMVSLRKPPI